MKFTSLSVWVLSYLDLQNQNYLKPRRKPVHERPKPAEHQGANILGTNILITKHEEDSESNKQIYVESDYHWFLPKKWMKERVPER